MSNVIDPAVTPKAGHINGGMDSDDQLTTNNSLRRVLRLTVATLLVIVVLELLFYLLIVPKLHLNKVVVTADFPVADSDVLRMAGLVGNEPFFSLDGAVISDQLRKNLIVAEGTATLHFPDTIRFELVSRKPVVMVLIERNEKTSDVALVDKTGLVFLLGKTVWDHIDPGEVPVISGLKPEVVRLGLQLPERIEKLLLNLYQIRESNQVLADLISEVRLVSVGGSTETSLLNIEELGSSFDVLVYPIGFQIPLRFGENVSAHQLSEAFFLLDAITSSHQEGKLPEITEIDFRSSPPVALFHRGISSGK